MRELTSAWPLFGLTVRCGDVSLRAVRDDDLPELVSIFPGDVEMDPAHPALDGTPGGDRARRLVQSVWRHRATWSVDDWALDLRVERDGRAAGVVTLEGTSFPMLRTVDTASWVAVDARGRGTAVLMRAGALGLAFQRLGAQAAISSARVDNAASLAVSRRLGYRDNGVSLIVTETGPAELAHLRLQRSTWVAPEPVEIDGLDPCLAAFGLA